MASKRHRPTRAPTLSAQGWNSPNFLLSVSFEGVICLERIFNVLGYLRVLSNCNIRLERQILIIYDLALFRQKESNTEKGMHFNLERIERIF
jgi:hypothetical protein